MDKAYLHTQFGGEEKGKLRDEMIQSAAVLLAMIETSIECGSHFLGPIDENAAGKTMRP